ncbi:MAG: histidine ammonia-lyase [Chloroflexi bacterium]|nr:histidine ammonia-lyase [Chloroflexota bacterium]
MENTIRLDGDSLTIDGVVAVARGGASAELSPEAKTKVAACRELVEKFAASGRVVYGITTGMGSYSNTAVPIDKARLVQRNYIRTHVSGVGNALPADATRAVMLTRANALAKGYSGLRLSTVEMLLNMINLGVHPVIPEKGTVGASGDLAPLSHMVLAMMGEGAAEYQGKVMDSAGALKAAGLESLALDFREGVGLVNATAAMTGIAALAVHDARRLVKTAEIAAALSLEALEGMSDTFDERTQAARPHPGQIASAANMRKIIRGSRLTLSLKSPRWQTGMRVQDAYSLRCIPQVMGAVRDALEYGERVIGIELNSASDNPLLFVEGEDVLHGGNFHGQPVGAAMDFLSIALNYISGISERRIARVTDKNENGGLPGYLIAGEAGVQCGFIGAHLTASSLVAENRALCHPASIQSIPTEANEEDVVSMGTIAARKAAEILRNTEYIVGLELLCAAHALDMRGIDKAAPGARAAYDGIRARVPRWTEDRVLVKDIDSIMVLVRNGGLVAAVEQAVGKLG